MKQKFTLERNTENNQLIIREFAELDKGALTMICEMIYNDDAVLQAAQKGKDALIKAVRNTTLYPVGFYVDRIIEALNEIYGEAGADSTELFFDDMDYLTKEQQEMDEPEEMEPDLELDDLLDEDEEELYSDEEELKDMNSLKISDSDGFEDDETS